jgi:NAD(P)-dependent dehydrogenase (short-subunit alcohol dehydrogenase family)
MSPSVNEPTVQACTELAAKVALVTGAGRGLGEVHARLLLQRDTSLKILADSDAEAGTAVATSLGPQARFSHLDVCDELAWARALNGTKRLPVSPRSQTARRVDRSWMD